VRAPRSRARALAATVVLLVAPAVVRANGEPGLAGPALPTRVERVTLSACAPCVRQVHPVATLTLAPLKAPPFPRAR